MRQVDRRCGNRRRLRVRINQVVVGSDISALRLKHNSKRRAGLIINGYLNRLGCISGGWHDQQALRV